MSLTHYKIRDTLADQSLKEIDYSYRYKKARMSSWNKNEDMMNPDRLNTEGKTAYGGSTYQQQQSDTRAQVPLYRMHGFVQTILSKIDNPLTFKYIKGSSADLKKAKLMNAIKEKDANAGRWNFKDLMGKRDAAIYGRTIYLYLTRNDKGGYKSLLNLIDPKDFLIDPDVGGLCTEEEDGSGVEKAEYLGWWNTKLSRAQLIQGVKDGIYYKSVVQGLLDGGSATTKTQQDIDKDNRKINGAPRERFQNKNQFIFYTWITTDENDDRYYLVLTPSGDCIRCEPWTDIRKSGKYPIWTWASFPDPREFWTPSYCDFARGVFMAQEKSINQSLDNSEQINRPQTAVNVDYIRNLAQVRYRKDGYIEIEGNVDVNRVLQTRQTPPIQAPFMVYDKLEGIVEAESGVTAAVQGTSDERTLGVYEGNLQQAGDRFGLLNKSYAEGYFRFAVLHKEGVMQDMKKKTAVQFLGEMGLDIELVTSRDLKPSHADYDILVESSIAEAQSDLADNKNKITFLGTYKDDPNVNQKVLFRTQAGIAGLDNDMVNSLLDTSENSDTEVVSLADLAFVTIVGGDKAPMYKNANTGFLQRLIDLSEKHDHELDHDQHTAVFAYIDSMTPIVEKNSARSVSMQMAKAGLISGGAKVGAASQQDPRLAAAGGAPMALPAGVPAGGTSQ